MATPGTATSMEMQDTNADAVKNDTISSDEARIGVEKSDDEVDIPPDGGYGWVVVACLLSMNSFTWGNNTTYGVFESYYLENNYYAGGSTFRYAWVGGLSVGVAFLMAPLANWLVKIFGFKPPMLFGMSISISLTGLIAGTVCVVLAQCMAGICKSYATFLVCQGVLFGIGLGMTMVPGQPLLAHWFTTKLSTAQGIANSGSGLGGLILANTTRAALQNLGVKWALIINGLASLVVMTPAVLLMKGRHKAVKARSQAFEKRWLWHPGFVWVWLWGSFTMLAYYISIYSLASFATSALHLSQKQGAALQSILSAGQLIGRPVIGLSLDRFGRINMTMIAYVFTGLSCLAIWLPAKSFGVLVLFAIIQGFFGGTIWAATTPLVASVVGVSDLASALSVFWIVLIPFSLCAQPIAIALLEYSTNHLGRTGAEAYYISIGFCGGVGICAAIMLYGAKVYVQGSWKLWQKA